MSVTTHPKPHFPDELYREIARNLHQRQDKDALLSLALVNKVWRHESQRVLFSSLSDDWDFGSNPTLTHILFLESIVAHPDRLGRYVNLYAQNYGIGDPGASEKSEDQEFQEDMRLWYGISQALPAMINLKHLFIEVPFSARSTEEDFLIACLFQLETLTWMCDDTPKEKLAAFLRTQHALTHFEIGEFTSLSNLSWLTPDMCPSLTSVVCNINSIGLLERRSGVVALKADLPSEVEHMQQLDANYTSFLARIQYLSVWTFLSPLLGPIAVNVSLLELEKWSLKTLTRLTATNFPNLRVLALLNDDLVLSGYAPLVRDSPLIFGRLPKLEVIFVSSAVTVRSPFKSHFKISLDRAVSGAVPETGWVLKDCRLGLPWWTKYDV
ncbi:hypothetical protein D9619_000042 [Psilocybe cf. subviscida]|uniref:Uncharacterized protein n=1 Tax=Psilocybe cf. subviscida TaxID=2480587 RepID=A0A8H5F442_9AGAR|nr:hypothetical protein D9619_000042 [Psilocybe cf. subviscida]